MARTESETLCITHASDRDFFPINRLHSLGYGHHQQRFTLDLEAYLLKAEAFWQAFTKSQ